MRDGEPSIAAARPPAVLTSENTATRARGPRVSMPLVGANRLRWSRSPFAGLLGTLLFVSVCALLVTVLLDGWLVVLFGHRHLDARGIVVVDQAQWPKTLKSALFFAVAGLTAVKLTVDREWRRLRTRADLALVGLGVVLLAAGIFGPSEPKLIAEAAFVYLRGAILFYASRALNPAPARIKALLILLGGAFAVETAVGLIQFAVGPSAYQASGWVDMSWASIGRAQGLLDHPNDLGHLAGLVLLGIFAVFAARETLSPRWWVALVVAGLCLAVSQSRESIVGVLVGLLLIALLRRGRWKRFAVVAVLVLLTAAIPVVFSASTRAEWMRRMAGVTDALAVPSGAECAADSGEEACSVPDREIRLLYYQQGGKLLIRRPLLGYGVGQFGGIVAYENDPNWSDDPRFQPVGFNRYGFAAKTVDAFWLHLVIEAGLLGLAAYLVWLWFLVAPFVRELRRRGAAPARRARAPGHPAYYWAPAAVMFVTLIALLSPSLEDPLVPPLLFTVVGIGWVVLRRNAEAEQG